MDSDFGRVFREFPESNARGHGNDTLAVDLQTCSLCRRTLLTDDEAGDLEAVGICGDCKFLFLEDIGNLAPVFNRRRIRRARRSRYNSSESIDNIFSQQFSNIVTRARRNQAAISDSETQFLDGDASSRLVQHTSSRTTPTGSRRWRRVISDTESEGIDSFYGESDIISFSAYGGDSDISFDRRSFLDNDLLTHPDAGSEIGSDTDIDPMHTGTNQWNSDDLEEEDDDYEEENEWEEGEAEDNTLNSLISDVQLRRLLTLNESNINSNSHRQLHSPAVEGGILGLRFRELEVPTYVGYSGDYLGTRGFEELLERLSDADGLQRGGPPTALSVVNTLERVVVSKELHDGLTCAICKESVPVGTVVNQLPCSHLYHPCCILPWLSSRNSCPLCRYELPTDDKDYENRKHSAGHGLTIMQQNVSEDTSEISEVDFNDMGHAQTVVEGSGREIQRRGWFFLAAAAAPIFSLVGIALAVWLSNRVPDRSRQFGHSELTVQGQRASQALGSYPNNQSGSRNRRWWSFF